MFPVINVELSQYKYISMKTLVQSVPMSQPTILSFLDKSKNFLPHDSACCLTLSQTSPGFYVSAVKVFGKLCGKRRNCS